MENNKLDNYMERTNIIVNYYEANPRRLTQKNIEYLEELWDEGFSIVTPLPKRNKHTKDCEVFTKLNNLLSPK